jgi:vacuolar-type H+-ATPase subunit B/Vma2
MKDCTGKPRKYNRGSMFLILQTPRSKINHPISTVEFEVTEGKERLGSEYISDSILVNDLLRD